MVILFEKFGNVSNNLFQHIHFSSFCKENNIEFINLTNSHLYSEKQEISTFSQFVYKFRKPLADLGFIKLIDFNDKTDIIASEELMKAKSTIFCTGWNYRNFDLVKKDREYYADIYTKNIRTSFTGLIDKNVKNIAVHIRRGDYEQWENGKYFYEDAVYLNAINRIKNLVVTRLKIFIFSNDKLLNTKLYEDPTNNPYFSKNDVKSDHYLMSLCDYIIGPPSSFSMWASYIGNTPFYHIKDKNKEFTLSDFEICNG